MVGAIERSQRYEMFMKPERKNRMPDTRYQIQLCCFPVCLYEQNSPRAATLTERQARKEVFLQVQERRWNQLLIWHLASGIWYPASALPASPVTAHTNCSRNRTSFS